MIYKCHSKTVWKCLLNRIRCNNTYMLRKSVPKGKTHTKARWACVDMWKRGTYISPLTAERKNPIDRKLSVGSTSDEVEEWPPALMSTLRKWIKRVMDTDRPIIVPASSIHWFVELIPCNHYFILIVSPDGARICSRCSLFTTLLTLCVAICRCKAGL